MITLDEARVRLLSNVRCTRVEEVDSSASVGRVLREDVRASSPLPPFDQSAMDGYAFAWDSLAAAAPWRLRVAGESRAGAAPSSLEPGTACRIFTGAPIPTLADTVVMQEDTTREGGDIVIREAKGRGTHVRKSGVDMQRGALALRTGSRLTAGHLALAHMVDAARLRVSARPRVAIVSTGTELRPVGTTGAPGLIPESNSAAIAALARAAGAEVRVASFIGDDLDHTLTALREALVETDLLVTIGGVSVGDYDFVRPAMERAGIELDFYKVALRPGKPIVVGHTAEAHVIGLPGNPSSALVTFALFGMPLLRSMQRDSTPLPMPLPSHLATACRGVTDRLQVLRGVLGRDGSRLVVTPHANQASGAATSLADSDVLVFIPPSAATVPAGTVVDAVPWSAF